MKNAKYYIFKILILTFTIILVFFIFRKIFTIDSIKNEKNIEPSIDYKIVEKIDKMTLDEKIGQMILSGFNGTCFNEELNTLLNDLKVGGVILFSRNIEDSKQLKKLTSDIIDTNQDIPFFISIDEEGGRVSRLPKDIKKFESSKSIGDRGDEKYAYENGREIGRILKNHNINMNFAPVLDIYSNPKNTVIGDRAFGDNEKVVSSMGIATMKGLRDENIIPVVKHFPGHGDTEIDSHLGLPIVEKNLKQLNELELIPFNKAIENGVGAVMVSHILIKEIDDKYPATLSYTMINDILRNDMKFENIVITDDMLMKAITDYISIEEASVKSIKAGADIILIGSDINKTKSVIERIKLAVTNNEISEERIDKSVYRILKQKEIL
ncbi:beta-N-acetylhexosaminidase [Paraclostridium bifermentans]|uniref:beta-N-acetylhexosaminidase n=1 Tax=Paraclostridium bifermentans TaxID=1490 RepID=A0AA44IFZ4_PARBF|nr:MULTISPECIES: beta-N-acetylhexosaminidase [Paraclostridium]MBN8047740.1 beta-N-acetylhexosaminidase [Paraclostridium bifermentans]MBZ6007343.1 beta-N-acetylhexosaminidase [Paraclostridium bifermentans]MDU0296963.1 beta-N-acetylhexosaminidase [Paraclostridium sp. MRS3W1]NME08425.1 beta-N-acetylhexosaminidase [Paraclostridium bifermentans]